MNIRLLLSALLLASVGAPSLRAQQVETHDLPPGARMRLGSCKFRTSALSVAVSEDGTKEVCYRNHRYMVRDLATPRDLFELDDEPPGFPVFGPEFSQDGRFVIRRGRKQVTVWEVATGRIHAKLLYPEGEQKHEPVGTSRGSSLVLTYRADKADFTGSRVWNFELGKLSEFLPIQEGFGSIACSPNGTYLAYHHSTDRHVLVHDFAKSRESCRIPFVGDHSPSLMFANEKLLVVTYKAGFAELFDVTTGGKHDAFFGWKGIAAVHSSADGKLLAFVDGSRLVIQDLLERKTMQAIDVPKGMYARLAFQNNGAILTYWGEQVVRRWDSERQKYLTQDENPVGANGCIYFRSPSWLVTINDEGYERSWDLTSGRAAPPRKIKNFPWQYASDQEIALSNASLKAVSPAHDVFDLKTNEYLLSIACESNGDPCILRRGRVAQIHDRALEVVDARSKKHIRSIDLSKLLVSDVAREMVITEFVVNSDLTRFVATVLLENEGDKPSSHVIVVADLSKLRRKVLAEIDFERAALALSNDESLASIRTSTELVVVSMDTGRLAGRIPWKNVASQYDFGKISAYHGVFGRDNRTIAFHNFPVGERPTILVFEIASGSIRSKHIGHHHSVYDLAFAPDSKTLASASKDTTVLIWNVGPHAKPGKFDADALWRELGQRDAGKAYEAMCVLAGHAEAAIGLCAARLPVVRATFTEADLGRWIGELEQGEFAVRAKAEQELRKIARLAAPALRKRLDEAKALETQKRLEKLLSFVDGNEFTEDELRAIRAVELIESFANANARVLLRRWSQGHAAAVLTIEATKALRRLESAP